MDLFYNGNFKQNIKKIKGDLVTYANRNNIPIPDDLYIIKFNPLYIGNNFLFIHPPFTGGEYFKDKENKYLEKLMDKYGIINKSITYCHLLPLERMNKNSIKSFKSWIHKLTDIVLPKLIVTLGEDAELSFISQKALLRDNHGKEIGEYNGTPIILTYPMEYYTNRAENIDNSYKLHIQENNWNVIKSYYDKLITKEN